MIRCGMSLDVTGVWHEKQLSFRLQEIANIYRNHFDGEAVPPPGEKTATADSTKRYLNISIYKLPIYLKIFPHHL